MINKLLLEISKAQLLANTHAWEREKHPGKDTNTHGRIARSKKVKTRPPKAIQLDEDHQLIDYNFKANPTTENKRQWGMIVYNPKKKDIVQLYCTCKDFNYRLMVPFERKKLADRETTPKSIKDHAAFFPNKNWTKKTNPKGKLFICKHLAALMSYI